MAERLTKAQCILLAVHFASESNTNELHTLCQLKSRDLLPAELVLRILLTYLPEVTPPAQYTTLVTALASDRIEDEPTPVSLDISHVIDISEATADKRLRKLTLLPLSPPSSPAKGPEDVVTRFVCHRASLIDQKTGLVALLPELVHPFLQQSVYLRSWYLSAVLPLLRLRGEYYPDLDLAPELTIEAFGKIDGQHGTELLLSGARDTEHEIVSPVQSTGTIGRDLKGLVGPWIYGLRMGEQWMQSKEQDRWGDVFRWLARRAVSDFATTVAAVEQWDGPVDVDLDSVVNNMDVYPREQFEALQVRYAQSALASCYAVEKNTDDAVVGAHSILVRLAEILHFEPPPEIATSVDQLPKVDDHLSEIHETDDKSILDVENLIHSDHPLTSPTLASYMFLQMLVYSAYQLASLGHDISIVNIVKLRMFSTADEQMTLLQRLLGTLTQKGKRDQDAWLADIGRVLWLWGWNVSDYGDGSFGAGALGKIKREALDREVVTALLSTGNFGLVDRLYIQSDAKPHKLSPEVLEEVILAEAMKCYDNASNGNRTRGSMKRCFDILSSFRLYFPTSQPLQRAVALVAATHSMSYYSLTLQHRVPFKPVNIRVAHDPLSLIEQILEQNPKSYTQLDDLISIGRNLTTASPSTVLASMTDPATKKPTDEALLKYAERRVIFMCIAASLGAHDFDTAYSYLMNRLNPSPALPLEPGAPAPEPDTDDISWRAAFLAGRHRPAPSVPEPAAATLRRLEQRTELLSLALLLAPPSALTEILSVYRRTEEEAAALRATEDAADLAADEGVLRPQSALPGGFDALGPNDGRVYGQPTRELGRMRQAEAPVGLFDLAQGAAKALTKNAFPLRSASAASRSAPPAAEEEDEEAWGWDEGGEAPERVRRRDMVASAVTGGLASGIGWVLGATPVGEEERRRGAR